MKYLGERPWGVVALTLATLASITLALERPSSPQGVLQSSLSFNQLGSTKAVEYDLHDVDADNDSDDDDDEEDDAKEDAKEEAEDKKKEAEIKKAQEAELALAKMKHETAQKKLDGFKDDKQFDQRVSSQVTVMANETQSPALSKFLGETRKELREYSEPEYAAFLQGKVDAAEKKVVELEKALGKSPSTAKAKAAEKTEKTDATAAVKSEKTAKIEKEEPDKVEHMSAEDIERRESRTWALSFFCNVALVAAIFAMAATENAKVRRNTWLLIDQVTLVFLAVLYFQAFDATLHFYDLLSHYHVLASVLHALVMLSMVLLLAFKFRQSSIVLPVLCGAGAHIVSFSSIHAAATAQDKVWLAMSYSWVMAFVGLAVLSFGLLIIAYLVYTAKKRAGALEDDDFMDRTDDLENDFGAMAFSVVFTMFMRFVITGHHPIDDDSDAPHTPAMRMNMLIYGCICLLIAALVVGYANKKADEAARNKQYGKKRLMTFVSSVSCMNVAWAFLYWGEWTFYETLYKDAHVTGHVMFAITCTFVGGLLLLLFSKIPHRQNAPETSISRKTEQLAVTAIALVVAWSWELCFDASIEAMVEGVSHPAGWKVTSALVLFSVVVPVYVYSMRPLIVSNTA